MEGIISARECLANSLDRMRLPEKTKKRILDSVTIKKVDKYSGSMIRKLGI